jgi:DNA-binding beta-propeller fold protein YncE
VEFPGFLQDNFLLVADSYLNDIYQISLISDSVNALFIPWTAGNNPVAVAFDPTTQDVYYSDNGNTKFISKYSLIDDTILMIYEDVNGNMYEY